MLVYILNTEEKNLFTVVLQLQVKFKVRYALLHVLELGETLAELHITGAIGHHHVVHQVLSFAW